MGRVSRPETAENYEFSKSEKFFWTFLEAQNRLNGAARGPTSIPTFFSETPQYVLPQLEVLGCSGARNFHCSVISWGGRGGLGEITAVISFE